MTSAERITALARSFPTLAHQAEGLDPWHADRFERWACGPVPSSGARFAAQFILSVWRPHAEWRCGPFLIVPAMGTWDADHRAAFAAWAAADPWSA